MNPIGISNIHFRYEFTLALHEIDIRVMPNEGAPIVTVKEIRGYREPKIDYSIPIKQNNSKYYRKK